MLLNFIVALGGIGTLSSCYNEIVRSKSPLLVGNLKIIFSPTKIGQANAAVGSFTIPSLYRTIEQDVFQRNPDLIVFHASSSYLKNNE